MAIHSMRRPMQPRPMPYQPRQPMPPMPARGGMAPRPPMPAGVPRRGSVGRMTRPMRGRPPQPMMRRRGR